MTVAAASSAHALPAVTARASHALRHPGLGAEAAQLGASQPPLLAALRLGTLYLPLRRHHLRLQASGGQ